MKRSIKSFLLWLMQPAYRALENYMLRTGMILCGSKGSSPKAPDFGPLAAASSEAARLGSELGHMQLAENRAQFEATSAILQPVLDAQLGIMRQTQEQGADYYQYSQDTFRPIEEGLAAEALSGGSRYSTNAEVRANIEQEATRASADAARAAANAEQQNIRAMLAMGVNPNSGRFQALQVGKELANAAARAGAQTQARTQGVALDYAKRMDVTGLGRGLPGASQGAYNVALNAGNSYAGNQGQSAAQYMSGLNAGVGTIMQGQGMNMQGLGNILNAQTSIYQSQLANQGDGGWGAVGGILGGAASLATAFSDRQLKEGIVKVDDDPRGFGIYEFSYIGDDRRYRGVMADEVAKAVPDAVVETDGGYMLVDYGMLGLQMTEVQSDGTPQE